MRTKARTTTIALSAVLVATGVVTSLSAAAGFPGDRGGSKEYRAWLDPVPHDPAADAGSNVTGKAKLSLKRGKRLHVRLKARGLSPFLPHAMHIHGQEAAGELARCPGPERRDDLVDDGLIETLEGLPDYGGILVSFTTRGDTSPASALALDRFPVARKGGLLKYRRTFEIPRDVASRLDELHIVVHGHDLDGNGVYGGRTTALGAPLEAELPVACGEIDRSRKKEKRWGGKDSRP